MFKIDIIGKKKKRSILYPWNTNYESLADGKGEYAAKVVLNDIKDQTSNEMNVCQSHQAIKCPITVGGNKMNITITSTVYRRINPMDNKIFIELDNEHCAHCDIGDWSTKKMPVSVKKAKAAKRKEAVITESDEGPSRKKRRASRTRDPLEDTDEDEDDPNKSNNKNSKKKDNYFEKMWIDNLKLFTEKFGDKITGKGICELNKRCTEALKNGKDFDVDTIPVDILAEYAIKDAVYTSNTTHSKSAPSQIPHPPAYPPSFYSGYPHYPYPYPYPFPTHPGTAMPPPIPPKPTASTKESLKSPSLDDLEEDIDAGFTPLPIQTNPKNNEQQQ